MTPNEAHTLPTAALSPADELAAQVRDVKRRLRGAMNGPVSQSMRTKGLAYRVNFGVELPRLREMAAELPHTRQLAGALWKEDIRECRLLAAMLQPTGDFLPEVADIWVEQMRFPEEAECTVMHLFARLPYASDKMFEWVARDEAMFRLCGWLLAARLFTQGMQPGERDEAELLDQLNADLRATEAPVRSAAYKALLRYMQLGPRHEQRAEDILQAFG